MKQQQQQKRKRKGRRPGLQTIRPQGAGVALFSWTPKIAWIGRGCSLERRG